MSIVTCPNCGAKNRVDETRASHEAVKCGRCGQPLPLGSATGGASATPSKLTDGNFKQMLADAGSVPLLVDCWAPWCGPCRLIGPVIDQLALESNGRYRVGKLNTDDNPGVAGQFHIDSIPNLLIFKSGKLVDRLVGLQPKPAIAAALQKWA